MYRYLPRETRGYLPQLVAMIYVLHHQEEFHLKEERLTFPTPLKSVRVSNQSIDLVKLAGQLQMCTDDIKKLNPEIKNLYLLKTQNQKIQIPENRYALFIQNKEKILQKSIFTSNSKHYEKSKKKIYYKVRKGDYLGKIARIFGTTVSQIKIWNQLSKNTIRIGQRIVIYRKFR